MRIGQLRHRLTIQGPTDSVDATFAPIVVWSDVAIRWGAVEPLSGRELTDARAVDARSTHTVRLRAMDELTTRHRILFGARVFHIVSIVDVDERERQLLVTVTEAV